MKSIYKDNHLIKAEVSIYSPLRDFQIPNFLNIQVESFKIFMTHGLIDQFNNSNRIKDGRGDFEIYFYPKKYKLSPPKWTPSKAVLRRKTYACGLYIPVQLTDYKNKKIFFQWVKLANLPMMTKHGHFIINGCSRVVMNQIVRSPGVYFQKSLQTNNKILYSADFIAQRGAWLRLEVDTKNKKIWAKLKKMPNIPIFLLLRGFGMNFTILNNYLQFNKKDTNEDLQVVNRGFTLVNYFKLVNLIKSKGKTKGNKNEWDYYGKIFEENGLFKSKQKTLKELSNPLNKSLSSGSKRRLALKKRFPSEFFLIRKFFNPRTYNLSLLGRERLNQKFGLFIPKDYTVLTGEDILFACLFLLDLVKGIKNPDDIDDLKNRKIKPCGELLQVPLTDGLNRLEKKITNKYRQRLYKKIPSSQLTLTSLLNAAPINSSLRDFFGTNPLSQLMDQINSLAEITHKRRLSCLGPGGIERDTANMAIRGIHATHYGRICPIETPEGKNAGLVNSLTIYSRLNQNGCIETPFWKTYKGLILNNKSPILFDSNQERDFVIAPGDINSSSLHFLPSDVLIPCRKIKQFKRVFRNHINYIAMSPIQMISIATSLIPFLEHNDGNRALMGSNMQRQALPTMKPSKPIVGTSFESRVISDIGHSKQASESGFVTYVDGNKIVIYSNSKHSEQVLLNYWFPLSQRPKNFLLNSPIQSEPVTNNSFGNSFLLKNGKQKNGFARLLNNNILLSMVSNRDKMNRFSSIYSKNVFSLKNNILVLNNKQLNLTYQNFFLNDFLGQLKLMGSFSNKVIQYKNNSKPFLFQRCLVLIERFSHQAALLASCKGILTGYYTILVSNESSFKVKPKLMKSHKFAYSTFVKTAISILPSQNLCLNTKFKLDLNAFPVSTLKSDKTYLETFLQKQNSFPNKHLFNSTNVDFNIKTDFNLHIGLKTDFKSNLVKASNLQKIEYNLEKFHGSNQGTYMIHRPVVQEGQWVEKGDILADNSSSQQGELSIGQNILVAYTPWEGYNFEDAVLISERLIYDDLYTSLHIERYEIEIQDTQFGMEQITRKLPTNKIETNSLDDHGIVTVGAWVEGGDILVGKVAPMGQKPLTPHEKLLFHMLGKKVPKTRNTSLYVPENIQGRVIHIEKIKTVITKDFSQSKKMNNVKKELNSFKLNSLKSSPKPLKIKNAIYERTIKRKLHFSKNFNPTSTSSTLNLLSEFKNSKLGSSTLENSFLFEKSKNLAIDFNKTNLKILKTKESSLKQEILKVYIYLAEKRMIQVGDKISGRHGNKGIISNILPRQDMPYLPDGTPVDIVLNPLGVPSRMNVGQIFECLLGLAGSYLGQNYKIQPFDELYGCEASRSLVYSKLYEASLKTKQQWLFNPNNPGKIRLFDGRTGECFKQPVTVGRSYILKLVHQVKDKIHARSTGPYSLVTQQPLRGRSKRGGQRVGEMEVWALEGFGAAYILQEFLTIKSDAMHGRQQIIHSILENKPMKTGTPESFKVLIRELQSACLDIYASHVVDFDLHKKRERRGIIDPVTLF